MATISGEGLEQMGEESKEPNPADADVVIASEEELTTYLAARESGERASDEPLPPEIRGVLAEVAATGQLRYPWTLMRQLFVLAITEALEGFRDGETRTTEDRGDGSDVEGAQGNGGEGGGRGGDGGFPGSRAADSSPAGSDRACSAPVAASDAPAPSSPTTGPAPAMPSSSGDREEEPPARTPSPGRASPPALPAVTQRPGPEGEMWDDTREQLEASSAAPFTVQRLAELALSPRPQYTSVGPFLRALLKVILVAGHAWPLTRPGLRPTLSSLPPPNAWPAGGRSSAPWGPPPRVELAPGLGKGEESEARPPGAPDRFDDRGDECPVDFDDRDDEAPDAMGVDDDAAERTGDVEPGAPDGPPGDGPGDGRAPPAGGGRGARGAAVAPPSPSVASPTISPFEPGVSTEARSQLEADLAELRELAGDDDEPDPSDGT